MHSKAICLMLCAWEQGSSRKVLLRGRHAAGTGSPVSQGRAGHRMPGPITSLGSSRGDCPGTMGGAELRLHHHLLPPGADSRAQGQGFPQGGHSWRAAGALGGPLGEGTDPSGWPHLPPTRFLVCLHPALRVLPHLPGRMHEDSGRGFQWPLPSSWSQTRQPRGQGGCWCAGQKWGGQSQRKKEAKHKQRGGRCPGLWDQSAEDQLGVSCGPAGGQPGGRRGSCWAAGGQLENSWNWGPAGLCSLPLSHPAPGVSCESEHPEPPGNAQMWDQEGRFPGLETQCSLWMLPTVSQAVMPAGWHIQGAGHTQRPPPAWSRCGCGGGTGDLWEPQSLWFRSKGTVVLCVASQDLCSQTERQWGLEVALFGVHWDSPKADFHTLSIFPSAGRPTAVSFTHTELFPSIRGSGTPVCPQPHQ